MKVTVFFIYACTFFYYVVLGGRNDFLVQETNYVNSEISRVKKERNLKSNEYLSRGDVQEIKEKYKESHGKSKEALSFQKKRAKIFSISLFVLFLFFIDFSTWSVLLFLSPFVYVAAKFLYYAQVFIYEFTLFPVLALLLAFLFRKFKFIF